MSVRYKFKNTLTNYETIIFDGDSLSLGDFKRAVVEQNKLSKVDDDLKVVNADTKHEFKSNDDLIPRNIYLIVSRVPMTPQAKKPIVDKRTLAAGVNITKVENAEPFDTDVLDLAKLNISEENKIEVMMEQSTAAYNPKTYQKTAVNRVPVNYQCNQYFLEGHWTKDCPENVANKKKIANNRKKAGIPSSFQRKANEKENKENAVPKPPQVGNKPVDVPKNLLCPICEEIFVDAVMISCCGNSFCDDCVRSALLDSTNSQCPTCKEKDASPDAVIPNRFLRKLVASFKNQSGVVVRPDSRAKVATKDEADRK